MTRVSYFLIGILHTIPEMSALEVQLQWKDLIHDKDQYMLRTCSSAYFILIFFRKVLLKVHESPKS